MSRSPRSSRSWATSLVCLSLLAWQTEARATEPETRNYTLDGVPGVWLPMANARKLLEDVAQLPKIREQLNLLQQRLDIEKERSTMLERNVQTVERIALVWKSTAESQAETIAKKDAWWKSPYLWLAIGVVVGTSATIGITYAVRRGVDP